MVTPEVPVLFVSFSPFHFRFFSFLRLLHHPPPSPPAPFSNVTGNQDKIVKGHEGSAPVTDLPANTGCHLQHREGRHRAAVVRQTPLPAMRKTATPAHLDLCTNEHRYRNVHPVTPMGRKQRWKGKGWEECCAPAHLRQKCNLCMSASL